ncbi:hypothetical protein [Deinococcus budaensis]|uniref:Uncharacterized protein n=1 Tax=Deinococcus budaensis TaxID=1665626 RepID=A0A7W8GF23_9DEIO|nr:hypothetical protein [Deinococcus budaensis]MBB5234313.1 hypothetical protein [Deinococcus budaensis]
MPPRSFPHEWRRLLSLTCAALLGVAGAHGEEASDLRGVTLCLDGASVQVKVEEMPSARAAQVQRELASALTQSLTSTLKRAKVRHQVRPSCEGRRGLTHLQAEVRYLNPRTYVGFGDPAYSYQVALRVTDPPASRPGLAQATGTAREFQAAWSDIHSEARTVRAFAPVVAGWGEETVRDLVLVWRRDNPSLAERLAQQGPLTLGLLGVGVGTLIAGAGLWWRRRRSRA